LDLEGEIITTPFSYVATTSSIVWENCRPVMADIDRDTLNIDPAAIERAITPETSAILATHVFGNPCDIEAIEAIAQRHDLKVIYDAAHAFGSTYKGRSLLGFGDISTCSFHATKLFHTVEGGAVITPDPTLRRRLELMRNFGHTSATEFGDIGINGKNSELHAAMGLCNLRYIDAIIERRQTQYRRYLTLLKGLPIRTQKIHAEAGYNCSYFPVLFESEAVLHAVTSALNLHSVFPRRYFYPSLSTLPYLTSAPMPVAEDVSRRVLCLPMYHTLSDAEMDLVCRVISRSLGRD
jgi:dTDP-4-amino-4,6-dideoxygalactose transaminase